MSVKGENSSWLYIKSRNVRENSTYLWRHLAEEALLTKCKFIRRVLALKAQKYFVVVKYKLPAVRQFKNTQKCI